MKQKYIKTPSEVLAQNEIDLAKAKHAGMSNPFVLGLQGLGGAMMSSGFGMMGSALSGGGAGQTVEPVEAAYGGVVGGKMPVEAEGGEVVTTANGQSQELKGPKHSGGGVDLMLGLGDKIFSDRITKDGKTMADREKARQANVAKLERMLGKTPGDSVLKNSMKRTAENNAKEEESDLASQQAIRQLMELANPPKDIKAPWGFDPSMFMNALNGMGAGQDMMGVLAGMNGSSDDFHTGDNAKDYKSSAPDPTQPSQPVDVGMKMSDVGTFSGEKQGNGFDPLGGMTGADAIGIAGNLYSGIAPMLHTMNTRAKDTPNVNSFENFGEDGLETIEQSKDFARQNNDALKADIAKNTNAAKRTGRIGARGINTQRAMDLAVEQGSNEALGNASSSFAEQMMGILGQQGHMENIQDQMVMGGEEGKDMRDRADKDNHASQMAQNIVGLGESVQQTGKDLNDVNQNEIIRAMLDQLSKYGLGFDEKTNKVIKKK